MDEDAIVVRDQIIELGAGLGEPALGALLDNDVVKEFPLLGSVVKLAKVTYAIPNLLFARKVLGFVSGMESKTRGDKEELHLLLSARKEKSRAAGEILLDALNRSEDRQKAAIIGRLFAEYLLRDMSELELRRLFFAVDRSFAHDLLRLQEWTILPKSMPDFHVGALENAGLVEVLYSSIKVGSQAGPAEYKLTLLGRTYLDMLQGYKPAPLTT